MTSLTDFITPITPQSHIDKGKYKYTDLDYDALDGAMPDQIRSKLDKELLTNGRLRALWTGETPKPSRSEYDHALAQKLVWAEFTLQETAHILWHYEHGKGDELKARDIIRSYNRVSPMFDPLPQSEIDRINAQPNPIDVAEQVYTVVKGELPKRVRSMPADELQNRPSPPWLIQNFIAEKSITVMYGASNVGKSFVASDIAGHLAQGRNWGNLMVNKPHSILYVCAEAGNSYGNRYKALKKRLGLAPDEKLPFDVITMPVDFFHDQQDVKDIVLCAKLLEERTNTKIGMVVIDTLATTFSGNENSAEDMGKYIKALKFIQHHADTAVLVVHHSGKDEANGARGSSSLRAATDTEIQVKSVKRGARYLRTIETKKQRETESDVIIQFDLNVHQLGVDMYGTPITSCSVILEHDSEFEEIIPTFVNDLNESGKAFLLANALSYSVPKRAYREKWERKDIARLLHNDILKRNGALVKVGGFQQLDDDLQKTLENRWDKVVEIDCRNFTYMNPMDSAIKRAYNRAYENVGQIADSQNVDINQWITQMRDKWDIGGTSEMSHLVIGWDKWDIYL